MGMLCNYGLMWYCPEGIANIISISNAENLGFEVSYSSASISFHVTNPKTGTNRVFTRSDCGLFYSDVAAPAESNVSGFHRR
jgi:hypothetical protein